MQFWGREKEIPKIQLGERKFRALLVKEAGAVPLFTKQTVLLKSRNHYVVISVSPEHTDKLWGQSDFQ